MLTDQEIDNLCSEWLYVAPGRTYEEHRPFARAIESAATAPLLARIAELERLRSEDHAHAIDLASEIERLTAERDSAHETLAMIGDFAHDRSTGPDVPDALWEVRAMAYTAAEPAIDAAIKEQT